MPGPFSSPVCLTVIWLLSWSLRPSRAQIQTDEGNTCMQQNSLVIRTNVTHTRIQTEGGNTRSVKGQAWTRLWTIFGALEFFFTLMGSKDTADGGISSKLWNPTANTALWSEESAFILRQTIVHFYNSLLCPIVDVRLKFISPFFGWIGIHVFLD